MIAPRVFAAVLCLAISTPALGQPAGAGPVRAVTAGPAFAAARARLDAGYDRTIAELIRITETPAPPFKEAARARLFADLLRKQGLRDVEIDAEGNVTALRPGMEDGPLVDAAFSAAAAIQRFAKGMDWSDGADPLVIDLDGDGIETTEMALGEVWFDVDGDLFAERTGWLKSGDGDGRITIADAAFAELKVWQDYDRDGVTDADELKTLGELMVVKRSRRAAAASNDNDAWPERPFNMNAA